MSKEYKFFNGNTYKTKGECKKAWRNIVQTTPILEWGKPLDQTTHIKYSDIIFLIENYFDDWSEYKKDNFGDDPIISFCIKENGYERDNEKLLHLEATSSMYFTNPISQKNFSCFGKGSDSSPYQKIINGFRGAILKQMMDFKYKDNSQGDTTICNCCGKITDHKHSEADHVITFRELVDNFIKEKNYSEDYLLSLLFKGSELPESFLKSTTLPIDKSRYWYFFYGDNQKVHNEFAEYHKEKAELQCLCKDCHKKKTSKERKKS